MGRSSLLRHQLIRQLHEFQIKGLSLLRTTLTFLTCDGKRGGKDVNQLKRLESGIEGLDTLLYGGFVSGASYIIQGRPGSGKTILANQIGFNHAKGDGRVLFATLLAEPHDRLFQFLSTLSFFDKTQVGERIQYISAFDTLENDGLDQVVKLLRREISRQNTTLLILDGLLNARSKAESSLDTKKFISELQGHAAFAGCTVLFLTSSQLDDGSPEHTMVDGVIEMGDEFAGTKTVRRIRLRKTRGSRAIPGPHEFEIQESGIVVYPRLETVLKEASPQDSLPPELITSGIETLDGQVGGGWVISSSTLLMGPSGVGKTSLGLCFLGASTKESPGLYFGFHESPQRLRLKATALGQNFKELEDADALHIAWNSTAAGLIDRVGEELLGAVDRSGAKRVFIDSLSGMARVSFDQSRVQGVFAALINTLRSRGVTVVASWEIPLQIGEPGSISAPDLSGVVDNLLLVHFSRESDELRRRLSILKIRDNPYDPSLLEVIMGNDGINVKKV
jgi:circadian clock protein KaiC